MVQPLTDLYDLKLTAGEKAQIIDRLISDSGIPLRNLNFKPEFTGKWGECYEGLKSQIGKGFISALVGGRSAGKTQLACELCKYTINLFMKPAAYITSTEFFMVIKEGFNQKKSEVQILRDYRYPRLLIIDEFGKSGDSEWHNTVMFELLNKRYGDLSDTILIDNNPKSEFIKTIGSSLASRIILSGLITECNWPSFRN